MAYDDAPSNGATLITDTDEEADFTITAGGSCDSPSAVKIAPGGTWVVAIPFEVKTNQTAATSQFTLSTDFADQMGGLSLTQGPRLGHRGRVRRGHYSVTAGAI